LPQFAAAVVDSAELDGDLVTFRVRAKAGDAACSGCRSRSSRVRRFKCVNRRCPQSTFSEQIPGLTTPLARRSPPVTGALVKVALAPAGQPGRGSRRNSPVKRLKRDGYGRANFDLLRAHVLIAA
jgi:hypothetical protein